MGRPALWNVHPSETAELGSQRHAGAEALLKLRGEGWRLGFTSGHVVLPRPAKTSTFSGCRPPLPKNFTSATAHITDVEIDEL